MDCFQVTRSFGGACIAFVVTWSCAAGEVSPEEEARWLRWLIPLPKEIEIKAAVTLPASEVGLRLRGSAGDVERTGYEELVALFKDKTGTEPKGGRFEILMGVCGDDGRLDGVPIADAPRLPELPNSEQAYVIQPVGERRLVLSALNERGVYYATQTLRQLLGSRFAEGQVTVPLVRALDWPDLAERGEWGGSANRDIVWLASHKMNLVETHITLGITDDGRGQARAESGDARAWAMPCTQSRTRHHASRPIGQAGRVRGFPRAEGQGQVRPRTPAQHHRSLLCPTEDGGHHHGLDA